MWQNKKHIIGIDVGGTHFRIGAVCPDGTVSQFRKIPLKDVFHTEDALGDLSSYLLEYIDITGGRESVRAVSAGFPATIDADRKTILQAPNVPYMENIPVVERLEETLGVPVFIDRDVVMTAWYDIDKYHLTRGILACFYFGTGVGNAICIDGKVLTGKNGTAGELGHIPAAGSDLVCGCGNRGCIENLAGGKYLAGLTKQERFAKIPIGELFARCANEKELQAFVDYQAMAVATEINILDPHYVVIGGGVVNMKGYPKELLEKKIREHTRKPYPEKTVDLIWAGDEEDKSVRGAAVYAAGRSGQ